MIKALMMTLPAKKFGSRMYIMKFQKKGRMYIMPTIYSNTVVASRLWNFRDDLKSNINKLRYRRRSKQNHLLSCAYGTVEHNHIFFLAFQ